MGALRFSLASFQVGERPLVLVSLVDTSTGASMRSIQSIGSIASILATGLLLACACSDGETPMADASPDTDAGKK